MSTLKLIISCICLFLAGAALQFLCGDVNSTRFAYPWSAVLFLNYLGLLVFLVFRFGDRPSFRSIFGESAGIGIMSMLLLLVLLMGITGRNLNHSWPFVLPMIWLMTLTGVVAVRDLLHIRRVPWAAMLFHWGLFLILAAAIFGNADKQRVTVKAYIDSEVAEGVDVQQNIRHLPFSLRLKAFHLEEYAPKLCLIGIDGESMEECLQIPANKCETLHQYKDWTIIVKRYIDEALPAGDSLVFQPVHHVGAAHAALVEAVKGMDKVCGWISPGSFLFDGVQLKLDDGLVLSFKPSSPKSFVSELVLTDAQGFTSNENTSVNHPIRFGSWQIYQKGYDVEQGKWSNYSVLECVNDPWEPITAISLWLMVLGAVVCVVESHNKSRKR